jgi:hypothetical protein
MPILSATRDSFPDRQVAEVAKALGCSTGGGTAALSAGVPMFHMLLAMLIVTPGGTIWSMRSKAPEQSPIRFVPIDSRLFSETLEEEREVWPQPKR